MKMNTPTAIFLGLALIAVAIFFRQPSISEAQAKINEKQTWTMITVGNNRSHILDKKTGAVYECYGDRFGCRRLAMLSLLVNDWKMN
jgi:hypothetical protein